MRKEVKIMHRHRKWCLKRILTYTFSEEERSFLYNDNSQWRRHRIDDNNNRKWQGHRNLMEQGHSLYAHVSPLESHPRHENQKAHQIPMSVPTHPYNTLYRNNIKVMSTIGTCQDIYPRRRHDNRDLYNNNKQWGKLKRNKHRSTLSGVLAMMINQSQYLSPSDDDSLDTNIDSVEVSTNSRLIP